MECSFFLLPAALDALDQGFLGPELLLLVSVV
jgi:hypothetical protein